MRVCWSISFSLVVAAVLVLIPLTCSASSSLRVIVRRQPGAPVHIDDCKAYINDTDVGNVNYYLDIASDYTNMDSKRSVDAIRLRFDLFNDFYEPLRTLYGNDSVVIEPNSASQRIAHDAQFESFKAQRFSDRNPVYLPDWEFINTSDTAKNMICSVDTIRFSDGTIWQAVDKPFNAATVGKAFQEYMHAPEAAQFYSVVSRELVRQEQNP